MGETYQETEDYDMKFALNTLKYGLLKDNNDIYNSLTRVPSYTFNELLLRVNEYVRVEDYERPPLACPKKEEGTIGVMESLISQKGRKKKKILVRPVRMDTRGLTQFSQNPSTK